MAVRFEAIERDGVELPMKFVPVDDGDRTHVPPASRRGKLPIPERPKGSGIFVFSDSGNLVLDQKFHSEWSTQ